MITKLRLQNFKSWEDTGDITFAPITGFFGTNSSGKTSLLQALLMMKQTVESNNRSVVLDLGGTSASYVDLGAYQNVVFQHKAERPLHISLTWDRNLFAIYDPDFTERQKLHVAIGKARQFNYTLEAGYRHGKTTVEEFVYHVDPLHVGVRRSRTAGRHTSQSEPGEAGEYTLIADGFDPPISPDPTNVFAITNSYELPPAASSLLARDELLDHFAIPDLSESLRRALGQIYYLGPLREYPARSYLWRGEAPDGVGIRGELTIPALIASQFDEEDRKRLDTEEWPDESMRDPYFVQERVAHWLQHLGLIHSFNLLSIPELQSYRVEVKVTENSAPVSLTDVGFGVSQVLPVLVLCYYVPRGSTLILEQPELHLHPSVQSGLADLFIDVMQNRDINFILESHSEHLLRRLQRRMAEEKVTPQQTALYFTSMQNGKSHLERLRMDKYGNILNWPEHFFGDEMGDLVAMTKAAMNRQN